MSSTTRCLTELIIHIHSDLAGTTTLSVRRLTLETFYLGCYSKTRISLLVLFLVRIYTVALHQLCNKDVYDMIWYDMIWYDMILPVGLNANWSEILAGLMTGNNQFLTTSFSSRRERIEVTEVGRRCEKQCRLRNSRDRCNNWTFPIFGDDTITDEKKSYYPC